MKTWNRLITVGQEWEEGSWWKEGKKTNQRTCMNDSWTWTTERGLTEIKRGELGGGGQKQKRKKLG